MLKMSSFQVVLFITGHEKSLHPLTDEQTPISLLPIAGKPLLYFTVKNLLNSGFGEIILVCEECFSTSVLGFMELHIDGSISQRVCLQIVPDGSQDADALRKCRGKLIRPNFILMHGNLFGNLNLNDMADAHQTRSSSASILFFQGGDRMDDSIVLNKVSNSTLSTQDIQPVVLGIGRSQSDFMAPSKSKGISPRLILSELEGNDAFISGPMLYAHSDVVLSKSSYEAGVYAFSSWILDFLDSNLKISSVSKDLLPILIQAQFGESRNLISVPVPHSAFVSSVAMSRGPHIRSETLFDSKEIFLHNSKNVKKSVPSDLSKGNEAPLEMHPSCVRPDILQSSSEGDVICCCYLPDRHVTKFCRRVDCLSSYLDVNRDVLLPELSCFDFIDLKPADRGIFVHHSVEICGKTQIGSNSVVAEGTKIGDKCSIKKSNVGKHCRIGNGVKVSNSVVMDYVTICDNVVVSNSVISSNAIIADGCQISACKVSPGFTSESNSYCNGENLL